MHHFLGLTIEEWGIMSGMAGMMVGGIVALFRIVVVRPLTDSIDHVAVELKDFRSDANAEHKRFDSLLDNHDTRLTILETKREHSKQ